MYEGYWGSWRGMKMCPSGKCVDGAQVRFEDSHGSGDDTALNGLEIRCSTPDFSSSSWVTVYDGKWGSWKNFCYNVGVRLQQRVVDAGKFVKVPHVRYESKQGCGDDTAMKRNQFRFANPADIEANELVDVSLDNPFG